MKRLTQFPAVILGNLQAIVSSMREIALSLSQAGCSLKRIVRYLNHYHESVSLARGTVVLRDGQFIVGGKQYVLSPGQRTRLDFQLQVPVAHPVIEIVQRNYREHDLVITEISNGSELAFYSNNEAIGPEVAVKLRDAIPISQTVRVEIENRTELVNQ